MNSSSEDRGTSKHKRRSFAMDSLLREASQFLKSGPPGATNTDEVVSSAANNEIPVESQQPPEGPRRSSRRLTQACKNTADPSTPMRPMYHASASCEGDASAGNNSLILCDDPMIQPSSPREMLETQDNPLEVEMKSLQIKTARPRRTACRKGHSSKLGGNTMENNTQTQVSATISFMETTYSGNLPLSESVSSSSNQEMEVEDADETVDADPELVAIYTNQKFVKPENTGLETIEETIEEVIDIEGSPVRSKRPRGAPKKKTVKTKQPWRFIPHLVVNPPEIWWQELPVKKQSECRKKAREAGYRPATKKRLLEAEKKVQLKLDELDRHLSATEITDTALNEYPVKSSPEAEDSLQISMGGTPCECNYSQVNETTFNSLEVFVGDTSSTSSPAD